MENLIYLVCGFIGVILHCLIKAKGLSDDAAKANLKFNFTDYLKADWIGISLSFTMVFLWFFLFAEAAGHYPKIDDFVRTSFTALGLFGSYAIQKIFSKGKKKINEVVDKKTNKADYGS